MKQYSNIFFNLTNSILVLAAVIVLHLAIKRRNKRKQLPSLSGPEPNSIFGNSLTLYRSEDIVTTIVQLTDLYKSPFKLWIGDHLYVVLSTAEHIELFFRNTKATGKTALFDKFKDVFGDSIFTSTGDVWKTKRKCLLSTMNGNRLANYVPVFHEEVHKFVTVLSAKINEEFNLLEYLPVLTFNIITRTSINPKITLAERPKFQLEFYETMKQMFQMNFKRVIYPWYHNDIIAKLRYGMRINKNKTYLRSIFKELIAINEETMRANQQYTNSEHESKSFVGNYAEAARTLAEESGQKNLLYEELLTALSAGTVNTSLTLGYFLLMMVLHPNIQEKVANELYDIFGDDDRNIQQEDISKLVYFDQVFKETLRRFTLIPFIFRSLETDLQIDDYTIPSGTNIAISILGVHFNPQYYPNPWNFNPENFSTTASLSRPTYAFIPFAAGPRDCLGKEYAALEMKIILINLLRSFKFDSDTKMSDIRLDYNFLVTNLNAFHVRIELRKKLSQK